MSLFKANEYVGLKKLGAVGDPSYDTPTWEDYTQKRHSYGSVPGGYIVEGTLIAQPQVGKPIAICVVKSDHTDSNMFRTSSVQKILLETEFTVSFETHNSRYLMSRAQPDFDKEKQ